MGRGGQAILRKDPGVLHVRTVAPLETRVRVVIERRSVSEKDARDLIHKSDRRRSAYLRDNYQINWDDVSLYHFTLNTGRTSQEAAARLIVEGIRCLS